MCVCGVCRSVTFEGKIKREEKEKEQRNEIAISAAHGTNHCLSDVPCSPECDCFVLSVYFVAKKRGELKGVSECH